VWEEGGQGEQWEEKGFIGGVETQQNYHIANAFPNPRGSRQLMTLTIFSPFFTTCAGRGHHLRRAMHSWSCCFPFSLPSSPRVLARRIDNYHRAKTSTTETEYCCRTVETGTVPVPNDTRAWNRVLQLSLFPWDC